MSGLNFGVRQTDGSSSFAYNGKGFKSIRSRNGIFKVQFNVSGTYFYSSGPVDPYGAINMKGQVIVTELKTKSMGVKVQVGEVIAPFYKCDDNQSHSVPSNSLSGVSSGLSGCVEPLLIDQFSLHFAFWKCSTPQVKSITPTIGTNSTILTIKGDGFENDTRLNEVKVGSSDCVVQTSSQNEITCLVTTGGQLAAGKAGLMQRTIFSSWLVER